MAIATMDSVLRAVLSTGNKEQNQAYPPWVFSTHFNIVTNFLLDEIAKIYPVSQSVIDVGRAFLQTELAVSTGGSVQLPSTYRNFLGAGIFVTADSSGPCDPKQAENVACAEEDSCQYPNDPLAPTLQEVRSLQQMGRCRSNPLTIVDVDEWDHLTNHLYKAPTLKKPIGRLVDRTTLKICPFGVPNVEIRYFRYPKVYHYGYRMLADDTYVFDPTATVESEWTENAMQYLIKGVSTLYGAFTRDVEFRDYVLELKNAGLF